MSALTAADRIKLLQDAVSRKQRENPTLDYSEVFTLTMNSSEMTGVVGAMQKPTMPGEENLIDAMTSAFTLRMVSAALQKVQATLLTTLGVVKAQEETRAHPILKALWRYLDKNQTTGNASSAAPWQGAEDSQIDEAASAYDTAMVRNALAGAVACMEPTLGDAAEREIFLHPLFRPLVEYVERKTGEILLQTANHSIARVCLRSMIEGALARHGEAALRQQLGGVAEASGALRALDEIRGRTTNIGAAVTAPAEMTASERAERLRALVARRQAERGESYNTAFAAVLGAPEHEELVRAMRQPADLARQRQTKPVS